METAVWISPTTHQENPMLDEQRQQFSIELAQDAPGLATAGLVELAFTLPQFEEQLDLPANTSHSHGLLYGQQVGWHVGDVVAPIGQLQARFADGLSLFLSPAAGLL